MNIEEKALEIAALVNRKNEEYGSASEKGADFLRTLHPNGIPPEKYEEVITFISMFNIMMRMSHSSYDNGYRNLAGYALLAMKEPD